MTDLDKKLQEMATKNWPQFVALLGEDAIKSAKLCLLRKNNKSYGEIMIQLKISKQNARTMAKKCDCFSGATA